MATVDGFLVRALASQDSLDELTAMLHAAYAPLAARGMNFTAATQTPQTTQQRVAEGRCLLAESGGALLGTVTVCGPFNADAAPWVADAPWFRARDTAHFHQFAVAPSHQGRGVGRMLVAAAEAW